MAEQRAAPKQLRLGSERIEGLWRREQAARMPGHGMGFFPPSRGQCPHRARHCRPRQPAPGWRWQQSSGGGSRGYQQHRAGAGLGNRRPAAGRPLTSAPLLCVLAGGRETRSARRDVWPPELEPHSQGARRWLSQPRRPGNCLLPRSARAPGAVLTLRRRPPPASRAWAAAGMGRAAGCGGSTSWIPPLRRSPLAPRRCVRRRAGEGVAQRERLLPRGAAADVPLCA